MQEFFTVDKIQNDEKFLQKMKMMIMHKNSKIEKMIFFYSTRLCYEEGKNMKILNYNFETSLEFVNNPNEGFRLAKNDSQVEFYLIDERFKCFPETIVNLLKRKFTNLRFHEKYKVLKRIGEGGFCSVFLVQDVNSKEKYAAKVFKLKEAQQDPKQKSYKAIFNELEIVNQLSHENIIKMYGVYKDKDLLYQIIEWIKGGTLQEIFVKKIRFPEDKIAIVLRRLLQILIYLKYKKIIHRDIKPGNILFFKRIGMDDTSKLNDFSFGNFCLLDFGLSTRSDIQTPIYLRCGTPGFLAPEILKAKSLADYSEQSDVFSVGGIFYVLLSFISIFYSIFKSCWESIILRKQKNVSQINQSMLNQF